jgi:transposase
MPRPSKYPAEFRDHAVELWRTSGKSQRAIALELGITNETLRGWIRQADLDQGRRHDGLKTSERDELRRLRAENKTLRMERDLLKKAAAFFARENDRTR